LHTDCVVEIWFANNVWLIWKNYYVTLSVLDYIVLYLCKSRIKKTRRKLRHMVVQGSKFDILSKKNDAKETRSVAEGCIIYTNWEHYTRVDYYNYLLREIIIKYIVSRVCVFNNTTMINYNNIKYLCKIISCVYFWSISVAY